MIILKDIPELIQAEVISEETADRIRTYYHTRQSKSSNKLFIVFSILGALLVGLGIILIIAHNWDELSQTTKSIFAFLPLLTGQVLCAYVFLSKQQSIAWRESAAVFLFLAVGACISLISQIYNIPGNISSFMLTWMLLCLPLVYIMRSSVASLLYLVGITYFACELGYMTYPKEEPYIYWLLLLAILPHYYWLYKNRPAGNFMIFHNWFVPLSVTITLGIVALEHEWLMYVAYMSLFGLWYQVGSLSFFKAHNRLSNGYKIIGALGTVITLLMLSFKWFWSSLQKESFVLSKVVVSPEGITAVLITLLAGVLLYRNYSRRPVKTIMPIEPVFIIFILIMALGLVSHVAVLFVNTLVLAIGILTIRNGARQEHLGILNYGLLIIAALVVCRFFDTDLSFVLRGTLFVSVGAGFFITNYWMLKKRVAHE